MHTVAFAIAKDLNLDVTRTLKVFLHVHFVVAEGGFAFGTGSAEGHFQLVLREGHFHATATTTGGCLYDDRIAHVSRDFLRGFIVRHTTVRTRNARNAQRFCGVFCGDLIAHLADVRCRRANKGQVVVFDDLHKVGIL